MKRLALLALLASGCATPSTPESRADVAMPLTMTVSAWAAYESAGENYIHLWSLGVPKSVFVVRERDVSPEFLETLRREVPMTRGVSVAITRAAAVVEAPTYVRRAEISVLESASSGR